MKLIGLISDGVLLVSPIWFILSKKAWCSSSFARYLKWASILSLACYLAGLLIEWLRPFPNTNLDNLAATIMMIAVGLILSILVSVSVLARGLFLWPHNRRERQSSTCSQTPPEETSISAIVASMVLLVAILAIVIPSFIKARNTSSQNACINNLRQIDAGRDQGAHLMRQFEKEQDLLRPKQSK